MRRFLFAYLPREVTSNAAPPELTDGAIFDSYVERDTQPLVVAGTQIDPSRTKSRGRRRCPP